MRARTEQPAADLQPAKARYSVNGMCGLTGIYAGVERRPATSLLLGMAGELRHRGPDGTGLLLDGRVGIAAARLAIVDPEGGDQPLPDQTGRFWAMQNGEIYNYVELRSELQELGHRFATGSDTEVIAHAFQEWGADCLRRFNGDFALAVWDRKRRELFLARDRFGVRPLFLAEYGGDFCFASEGKALLRHPAAPREIDAVGVVDRFTLWSTLPDHSAFKGIRELPSAHYAVIGPEGRIRETRWWDLEFAPEPRDDDQAFQELEALLVDATRIRLRADVPVGAYLSGGLDSSVVAAIASRDLDGGLSAFGVGFANARFDESAAQERIARELGVNFQRSVADNHTIGQLLPRAVELGETPLLRTAPAPLLLLSAAVREAGLRVVLTGEGADELFAGYDIFREDKVRRFWAREPSSDLRPLLFQRLNQFLSADTARARGFLPSFYRRGLLDLSDPLYSHRLRFANSARCLQLLNPSLLETVGRETDPSERLRRRLPEGFGQMSPLSKAQYVEIATFLEGYILHAQGDRMLMGNSIEGRFPYLDHRVAEFAACLPDRLRLRGLEEKYALRAATVRYLPPEIRARRKQPYRAPIGQALMGPHAPEYVRELLAHKQIDDAGLLDPRAVARLLQKFERAKAVSETDEMGLVGVVSLMLLHERFISTPRRALPLEPTRLVVDGEVVTGEVPAVSEAI
jgi:asparagine synthase (glutamine-hydrolysing)